MHQFKGIYSMCNGGEVKGCPETLENLEKSGNFDLYCYDVNGATSTYDRSMRKASFSYFDLFLILTKCTLFYGLRNAVPEGEYRHNRRKTPNFFSVSPSRCYNVRETE
uniref:Uncharacterized protein n=1 Tax=Romanomermis culicivorax TaxID=13658 RepID=A0A915I4G7_ROMCU